MNDGTKGDIVSRGLKVVFEKARPASFNEIVHLYSVLLDVAGLCQVETIHLDGVSETKSSHIPATPHVRCG